MKLKRTGVIHSTPSGFDFRFDKPLPRAKAIRLRCLDCCAGSSHEVKLCTAYGCGNWPYRLGRGICVDPAGEIVTTKRVTGAQRASGQKLARNKRRRPDSDEKAV